MTNKETLSALILMRDNCVNKREYDDPMREIKQRALEAAIKAIDNQERMQRELKSPKTRGRKPLPSGMGRKLAPH